MEVNTKYEGTCIFVFISTFATCYLINIHSEESIENIQYKNDHSVAYRNDIYTQKL